MPSFRVAESILSISAFDVVGCDGAERGFINHAGLAKSTGSQDATGVPVLDMGPPLHGPDNISHMEASVIGSAGLTVDEVRKIETFVDRHANEHRALQQMNGRELLKAAPQMYCVRPHASPFLENDKRYTRMRFSCAGFVLEAYKKARIELLDSNLLPMVSLAVIKLGYPREVRFLENGRITAEELGLEGNGPWPVLLCGYLFHSLDRDVENIRSQTYTPSESHRVYLP